MMRVLLGIGCLLLAMRAAAASTVSGAAIVDGKPVPDAVVYLEAAAAAPVTTGGHATMDQRNLQFVPKVLPVVRGTTVEFTNGDDIQHNVFSPSSAVRKFDLGAYGPGAARSVQFDEPGEVLVLCNIHMEMEAHILVLRDPYFAMTARDGSYRITDVPPGQYTAKLWRGSFLPDTHTVDVPDTPDFVLNLRMGPADAGQ